MARRNQRYWDEIASLHDEIHANPAVKSRLSGLVHTTTSEEHWQRDRLAVAGYRAVSLGGQLVRVTCTLDLGEERGSKWITNQLAYNPKHQSLSRSTHERPLADLHNPQANAAFDKAFRRIIGLQPFLPPSDEAFDLLQEELRNGASGDWLPATPPGSFQ